MIELMYASGLRVSELVNLEINNINLIDNYVRVYGKGRKERIIPLASSTCDILDSYINIYRNPLLKGYLTDKVFISSYGKGITRQGFFKILKKNKNFLLFLSNFKKNIFFIFMTLRVQPHSGSWLLYGTFIVNIAFLFYRNRLQ